MAPVPIPEAALNWADNRPLPGLGVKVSDLWGNHQETPSAWRGTRLAEHCLLYFDSGDRLFLVLGGIVGMLLTTTGFLIDCCVSPTGWGDLGWVARSEPTVVGWSERPAATTS
jgi:hypothetical protein